MIHSNERRQPTRDVDRCRLKPTTYILRQVKGDPKEPFCVLVGQERSKQLIKGCHRALDPRVRFTLWFSRSTALIFIVLIVPNGIGRLSLKWPTAFAERSQKRIDKALP